MLIEGQTTTDFMRDFDLLPFQSKKRRTFYLTKQVVDHVLLAIF